MKAKKIFSNNVTEIKNRKWEHNIMSPKIEEFKHKKTVPTDEHILTYNLQLSIHTYQDDGQIICNEIEKNQQLFDEMEPSEQIKYLLQICMDISGSDQFEYEALQSIDVSRMLKTTFKTTLDNKKSDS